MRRLVMLTVCLAAGCYYPAYAPTSVSSTPESAPDSSGEVVVSGGAGTEVLVEGVAALPAQGGADIARDYALADALRKAVEQGVGTFVSSETRVENFQLISDNIYSQTKGYVSSYRVVTEGLEGALYRVVIRAVVKLDDIENDLAAIGLLVLEQGRPRIMVMVKEAENWSTFWSDDRGLSQSMIETMIVDAFQQKGFPVVDAATVRENLEKEQLRRILDGDNEAAVLVGLKVGAEVVVTGLAERMATRKHVAGALRSFYRFRMSARAINTETAEILGASATTIELPFSEDQARHRSADTTSAELISKILGGWKKHENVTVIVASNADFALVQQLKSEISGRLRGVIRVISRDLVGSSATLEVISGTSTQEVRDGLTTRGITVGFEVTGFSGNRIDIRFTGDPDKGDGQ